MVVWSQEVIQRFITDKVEESLTLDYKAAAAIARSDEKKREITKDVSSMANSDGGTILYGVAELAERDRKHLPEKLDPVDRSEYSKEWLEQVINGIRPRIDGLLIHPVPIGDSPVQVVYVVEIPKSTTAHQAKDYRYYRRFNFESVPMEDYELRDVLNRAVSPDVTVDFGYNTIERVSDRHRYWLTVVVRNQGQRVVENFKLQFALPGFIKVPEHSIRQEARHSVGVDICRDSSNDHSITYRSSGVLFPQEELDLSPLANLEYRFDQTVHSDITPWPGQASSPSALRWVLYADDMPPRRGEVPLSKLNEL